MNKLLTALFAGAIALTLGSAAIAADAAKTAEPAKADASKVAEPVKAEEAKATEPAKTEKKVVKKHHGKHSKKVAETAPAATEASAAK